jgi:hypothetical protein
VNSIKGILEVSQKIIPEGEKGKRQKSKVKSQKSKGKRQKAKVKRQKAKGKIEKAKVTIGSASILQPVFSILSHSDLNLAF